MLAERVIEWTRVIQTEHKRSSRCILVTRVFFGLIVSQTRFRLVCYTIVFYQNQQLIGGLLQATIDYDEFGLCWLDIQCTL